jgi:hypothetical protein
MRSQALSAITAAAMGGKSRQLVHAKCSTRSREDETAARRRERE